MAELNVKNSKGVLNPYKAPKLIVYGSMTALTASGTNPGKENSGDKKDLLP